ncbi:hypothetical protein ABTD43_18195, partial [Acinetobacter baumannii]
IRHVEPIEIGTLAAGAGIVLSHLQSKGASLEDIFLELVSGVRTHPSAAGVTAVPDAAAPTPEPPVATAAEPAPSTDLVAIVPAPRSAVSAPEPDPG